MDLTPQEREYILRKLRKHQSDLYHYFKQQLNPPKMIVDKYETEYKLQEELINKISEYEPKRN